MNDSHWLPTSIDAADLPGAYAYEDSAQGERLLKRQMEALDARRSQGHATGTVRTAAPATHFTLVDHPLHDGSDAVRDQLVILRAQHSARNNLRADHKAQVISLLGQLAQDKLGVQRAALMRRWVLTSCCSLTCGSSTRW